MRGILGIAALLLLAGGVFYWLTLSESSTQVVTQTSAESSTSDPTLPKPGPVDPVASDGGKIGASRYEGERIAAEENATEVPSERGAVTGRVVGEDGKPIAKVTIEAMNAFVGLDRTVRLPKPAESDADGRFFLRGVPIRIAFDLEFKHMNFRTQIVNLVVPEEEPFKLATIVLKPAAVLTGIVIGPNGKPLPRALVQVRSAADNSNIPNLMFGSRGMRGGGSDRSIQTDAAGRWVAGGLDAGRYRVNASSADCVRSEDVFVVADLKAQVEAPAISLTLGKTITGRVVDADGSPVEGAMVSAGVISKRAKDTGAVVPIMGMESADIGPRSTKSVPTGADGSFRIAGIVDGNYKLTATAPGFVGKPAEASAGASEVVVKVERGGMAAGLLIDADGKPVIDPKISVVSNAFSWRQVPSAGPGAPLILRGADAAKVSGLPLAPNLIAVVVGTGDVSIDVVAGGCGRTEFNITALVAGEVRKMDFKMLAECTIVGSVCDEQGVLLKDAQVSLHAMPDANDPSGPRTAMVGSGMAVSTLSASPAHRVGSTYRGTSASGAIAKAKSGEDGKFTLTGFPDGNWMVEVALDGFLASSTPVVVELRGRAEVKVVLSKAGKITGRVLTADGTPVPGKSVIREIDSPDEDSMVAISGMRFGSSSPDMKAISDADGRFLFSDVRPGKYRLELEKETLGFVDRRTEGGQPPPPSGVPVVVLGSETVTADVRVPRPARVSGVVIDAGGPVAGIRVELSHEGMGSIFGMSGKSVVTDDRGQFHFDGIEPGSWNVNCRPKDAPETVSAPAELEEGADTQVTLKLPGGVIEGFVRDDSGAAVVGARVEASRNGGSRSASIMTMAISTSGDDAPDIMTFDSKNPVTTGADGSYRIAHMAAGPWNVTVKSKGHQPVSKDPVTVVEGQVVRADFTTQSGGAVELLVDGEARFRFVQVTPKDPKQPTPEPTSGAAGKPIVIRGLAPGIYTYNIDGSAPESEATGEFTVRSGETTRVNVTLKAK